MAESNYKVGDYKKASIYYKKALKKLGDSQPDVKTIRLLLGLGDCYNQLNDLEKADQRYSAALAPAKKLSTEYSGLYERCLDSLAGTYFQQRRFDEAASLYDQLVKYDETTYGADSIQLLWALLDLAWTYRELKRTEMREVLLPRILRLLEAELQKQDNGADNNGRAEPAGTYQNRPLPLMVWRPPGQNADAIILCVHGLGLHASSFQGFAQRMNQRNFGIIALDVRGFGSWQVARGHDSLDINRSLRDIEALLNIIHTLEPGKPVFLLGESMGGAIALRFASLHPELIDGVISSVPADKRFRQKSDSFKVAVNFVKHKNKQMSVLNVLKRSATIESVSPTLLSDPLMRSELSPKELLKFQIFMVETTKMADKIDKIPVLMLQGMKDRLVKPGATIDLYNSITSADRDLLLVGQCQHLIFEEVQTPDPVFDSVVVWLKDHMKKPTESIKQAASSHIQ